MLLIEQNLGVAIDVADRDRRDGQRPHRARDVGAPSSRPTATCSSGCSACAPAAPTRRRRRDRARRRGRGGAGRRSSRCGARTPTAASPLSDAGAAAACAASIAGTPVAPRRRWPTSHVARPTSSAASQRRSPAAVVERPAPPHEAARAPAHGVRVPGRGSRPRARPTSPALSTPRAASSSSSRQCLEKLGLRVVTVDLSTSGKPSTANVHPREVARHHPRRRARGLHRRPRQRRSPAMAIAFEHFVRDAPRPRRPDRPPAARAAPTLATPAMRALPVGVPKVMVSTVASGDTRPYVGPSDICMMYSVTDVPGINRISEQRARERRPRARRHDRPRPPAPSADDQAGARPDDVRRDDAVRAGGDEAARGRLRLPRLPRHRHRRPVDGEARRLGPAGRRDRRHDDRGRRRDRRRRAVGRARTGFDVIRAARAALRRLVRRARHGQLRRAGHGARAVSRPQPLSPQPERDADAHDRRRVRGDRRLDRRASSTRWTARCAS